MLILLVVLNGLIWTLNLLHSRVFREFRARRACQRSTREALRSVS
jgi:hypothetical protein